MCVFNALNVLATVSVSLTIIYYSLFLLYFSQETGVRLTFASKTIRGRPTFCMRSTKFATFARTRT